MDPTKSWKRSILHVMVISPVFILSYYCTTEMFHSLRQFISREAMFLLCNGIMVFIARDFGVMGSKSSLDGLNDEFIVTKRDDVKAQAVGESNVSLELVVVGGEEGDVDVVDELEPVGYEDSEALGADELNKRCEEFIEKVKREIRSEVLHPVMV